MSRNVGIDPNIAPTNEHQRKKCTAVTKKKKLQLLFLLAYFSIRSSVDLVLFQRATKKFKLVFNQLKSQIISNFLFELLQFFRRKFYDFTSLNID